MRRGMDPDQPLSECGVDWLSANDLPHFVSMPLWRGRCAKSQRAQAA
jgi:hypothetical protein